MGYSLSWIAVKGRTPEDLHRLAGCKSTGKQGDYGKHSLVGCRLQDGWYLLIADSSEDRITHSKSAAELSKGGQAVVCSIEEHLMFSSCAFWDNGKKKWSVKHRGERSEFDLVKTGRVPTEYAPLADELTRKQKEEGGDAEVDHLFDLPLLLGKRLAGFKHDEEGTGPFEILELNFSGKVRKAFEAAKPWLYLIGTIVVTGFIILAVGLITGRVFDAVMRFLGMR